MDTILTTIINNNYPLIHIRLAKYINKRYFHFIDIDFGRNKYNIFKGVNKSNYWFDFVIMGIGFNYDSSYSKNNFRFINNWINKYNK